MFFHIVSFSQTYGKSDSKRSRVARKWQSIRRVGNQVIGTIIGLQKCRTGEYFAPYISYKKVEMYPTFTKFLCTVPFLKICTALDTWPKMYLDRPIFDTQYIFDTLKPRLWKTHFCQNRSVFATIIASEF